MSLGYNRSLYLLPFDHRNSYLTGMFNLTPPLTAGERESVVDSKRVIYDGFRQAVGNDVAISSAAILVDEEFGADILRDAVKSGYVTALSTEKSGSNEFEFEYGAAFAEHIEAFAPTFAKVLVRSTRRAMAPSIGARRRGSNSCLTTVGPRISCSCSSCWCRPRRRRWIASRQTSGPTTCGFAQR